MKTYLIFDMSNLLYRTFHANIKENEDILLGMCHHAALMSMNYLFNKYRPDDIVAIFDAYSWRKEITKEDNNPITYKTYKGNRRQKLTSKQIEQFKVFDSHIGQFYEYLKNHSSLIVLRRNYLECDDLVAGFVDTHNDCKNILISSDKDFLQLLDNPNLTIIDPITEKPRSLSDWEYDAKLFMFEKCIRGDASDNVMSSYPRLRKKKIIEAYHDEYAFTNIMAHEFDVEIPNGDELIKKHYRTEEVYKENELLMDLRKQPEPIRRMIFKTIDGGMKHRGEFNLIKFLKFCNQYDLEMVKKNINNFTKLLSLNGNTGPIIY